MRPVIAFLLAIVALGLAGPVQVRAEASNDALDAAVVDARAALQAERRVVIAANMDLTPAESEAFWPIYDRYAADMAKVGDRRVTAIKDYSAAFDTMDDATATRLLNELLSVQEKTLKIRRQYQRKFGKALPPIKVARFYHLEHKLDTIVSFQLASEIPLITSPR
jgi:hypothetical protein